jgi:HAD superfamily hydrolase (TIGR01509 family)
VSPNAPSSELRAFADLPEPSALLFDLDGTLVDTVNVRLEAWVRAFARLGIAVDRDRLGGYLGSDGRWLAAEMARASGREFDYAAADEMDQAAGAIFDELNVAPVPLPGATELLAALEESHFTFAIATASQPGQVAVSVAALRLPSPPQITDAGHVEHAKPAPDLLLVSAAQLGVPPERCWYIGDSTWDMMAALRAGMVGVGVTTGVIDAEGLRAAGASATIDSLTSLLERLRGLGLLD